MLAWWAVGECYSGGSLPLARRLCDEMMTIAPWDGSAQIVLAVVRFFQGEDVVGMLSVAENPKSEAALATERWLWATIHADRGDARRAAKAIKLALKIDRFRVYAAPVITSTTGVSQLPSTP